MELLQASDNRGIASPELIPIISLLFSELMCPQESDLTSVLYKQKQSRGRAYWLTLILRLYKTWALFRNLADVLEASSLRAISLLGSDNTLQENWNKTIFCLFLNGSWLFLYS